jgi:CRP-like cAMP-binding protein
VARDRYLEHLKSVPLFAGCTKKQLQHVAAITTELRIPSGTTLMTEGTMAHEFIVIMSGTAVVRRNGRKLAELGPGDFIGELALIMHRPRTATVVATSDMDVLVVDGRSFGPLLDEVPGLARQLLTTVAERLSDNAAANQLLH